MTETEPIVVAGLRLHLETVSAATEGEGSADDARSFGLWVVDDPDALIEEMTQEEFDSSDERMPYFGLVWPSAESLAAKVLAGPRLDGLRVLDLGCGLGLCGFAALRRGAHVTFFDWEPRALEVVASSARAQPSSPTDVELVVGDWRTPPPLAPLDLILGADVLYEERNGPAVAAFLARHLKPEGEAWIADPGRRHAQDFPTLAHAAGLALVGTEPLPPRPHGRDITLFRLQLADARR